MVAVGLDANGGLFPIVLAWAESKNSETWMWLMALLDQHIGEFEKRKMCFMSDKQKGLVAAINKFFPTSHVRFCARHIYANLKCKHLSMKMRSLFWAASKATRTTEFNGVMNEIKKEEPGAHEYLSKIQASHRSRHAFDDDVKVEHVTNNMIESFNNWLKRVRSRPIVNLFEVVRRKLMRLIVKRNEEALKWTTPFPPNVMKYILQRQEEGRVLKVLYAGDEIFEVLDGCNMLVNLNKWTCSFYGWQLCGLPCKHGVACIMDRRYKIADYVHPYFTKASFLKTYFSLIHPVPSEKEWVMIHGEQQILPPIYKPNKGRPPTERHREATELEKHKRSEGLKCGYCNQFGHNQRTCREKLKNSTNEAQETTSKKVVKKKQNKRTNQIQVIDSGDAINKKQKMGESTSQSEPSEMGL